MFAKVNGWPRCYLNFPNHLHSEMLTLCFTNFYVKLYANAMDPVVSTGVKRFRILFKSANYGVLSIDQYG